MVQFNQTRRDRSVRFYERSHYMAKTIVVLNRNPDESDVDYAERMRRAAEKANADKRAAWVAAILAGIAALACFLFAMFVLWDKGDDVGKANTAASSWKKEADRLAGENRRLTGELSSCKAAPQPESALGKALSECLAKLPNGLPYQPSAPAQARAAGTQKHHDSEKPTKKSAGGGHDPGFEICRLRSDGTARLKSNPANVLPRDYVIATDLKDPESPNAALVDKQAGEDCNAWRARVTANLVDKTSGGVTKR